MDFVQGLDPSKLVLAGTALSFFIAPFTAPTYNLPIFLFGAYAHENAEAVTSLQTFTGLLGGSLLWDIVWMSRNEQNWFIKLISIVLFFVKIPTFMAFGLAMRQRGAQFGGIGIRGGDLSGPTVWSMPGGFTSSGRDGYQNMDEEAGVAPPPRAAPSHAPPAPAPASAPPPGGPYQAA